MKRLKSIHKVQELVFEIKIRDAETKTVVALSPDTKMSEVRHILRSNKIAAAPVLENDTLLGIISVNDYINWLTERKPDFPVSKCMSRNVQCLYDDEPLVDAIKSFETFGFYEFPVLDRETGKCVGVITRRDVIMGLLQALEINYEKNETSSYSGHHFFNEVIAEETTLVFKHKVPGKEINRGGEAASGLKKNLKYLGIHPAIIRRVTIATYEAEMNLIIYGGGGDISVILNKGTINVEIKDEGPGIPDIEKVLQPGFSTAPDWVRELGFGAGMGFTNIQSCVESLDIDSTVGKGTVIRYCVPLEHEECEL